MFERFTKQAREVVAQAHDEARTFGHNYIGTEHLLVGLLRDEESVAFRVLESSGIHLDDVLGWIERTVGRGSWGAARNLAFTPNGKAALLLAVEVANELGHEAIDGEHVLLALTRLEDGLAARMLGELGAEPAAIAEETRRRSVGASPTAD